MCRPIRLILLSIVAALLAGCASTPARSDLPDPGPTSTNATASPSPSASEAPEPIGSVRQDETECSLAGIPAELEAGEHTLEVINATPKRAAFDLFRIGSGGSLSALIDHIDLERERAEAGEPFAGPPPWADHVAGSNILPAGERAEVAATLEDGTYAFVCLWTFVETSDPVRPFAVAGPIQVGHAPIPSAPAEIGTISLTADSCTLDQESTAFAPGPVTLVAVNETVWPAAFDLWRIADGHTFEDLQAHIDAERERAEAGQSVLGHPGFVGGLISSGPVPAGGEVVMRGSTTAGTYGIVCLGHYDAVPDDPFRPFALIGPLLVED
jgi:hypothetical protein